MLCKMLNWHKQGCTKRSAEKKLSYVCMCMYNVFAAVKQHVALAAAAAAGERESVFQWNKMKEHNKATRTWAWTKAMRLVVNLAFAYE